MKASVFWCVEFFFTVGTKPEGLHTGIVTVIRQPLDNAVTRTALGAVGERVAVASLRAVGDFPVTVITEKIIRRDLNVYLCCRTALLYVE